MPKQVKRKMSHECGPFIAYAADSSGHMTCWTHIIGAYYEKKTTSVVFVATVLSAQYFSSFKTASGQYLTSVLCAHSLTEAVYFLALAHVRFKSRSHDLMHPLTEIFDLPYSKNKRRFATHFDRQIQVLSYLQCSNIIYIFTENAFIHLITSWPKSQTKLPRLPPYKFSTTTLFYLECIYPHGDNLMKRHERNNPYLQMTYLRVV